MPTKAQIKKDEEKRSMFLKLTEARMPSALSILCQGCFSIRNSLTVKGNLDVIWKRDLVKADFKPIPNKDEEYIATITVPCYLCHELRQYTLNEWSSQKFKADWDNEEQIFMLKKNKDNGYVSFVAISAAIIPDNWDLWCNPE